MHFYPSIYKSSIIYFYICIISLLYINPSLSTSIIYPFIYCLSIIYLSLISHLPTISLLIYTSISHLSIYHLLSTSISNQPIYIYLYIHISSIYMYLCIYLSTIYYLSTLISYLSIIYLPIIFLFLSLSLSHLFMKKLLLDIEQHTVEDRDP